MPDGKPINLAFDIQPDNYYGTTYAGPAIINGFLEKTPAGTYSLYKRSAFRLLDGTVGTGLSGLGMWASSEGYLFGVWGTQLWGGLNIFPAIIGAVNGGSFYTFADTITTSGTFLHNNSNAYVITGGSVVTAVTDVNYPTTTVPGAVWLDGTYYVMDSSANIRGSSLNDPFTWPPLNTIQAQIESDHAVALARQLSYIIAFKEFSTEVFYNAGNATGSPLARQTGSKVNLGCSAARTVQSVDGVLYWVAQSRQGILSVVRMENLTVTKISTQAIDRLLTTGMTAVIMAMGSHQFYVLTGAPAYSLAFDLSTGLWFFWLSDGTRLPISTSAITSLASTKPICYLQGSAGMLFWVNQDSGTDDSFTISTATLVPYNLEAITPSADFKTRRKKYLKFMDIVSNFTASRQSNATSYSRPFLRIRHSDDGYRTWSNFRQVDLSLVRPRLANCGTFTVRSFHLRFSSDQLVRLDGITLDIEEGTL